MRKFVHALTPALGVAVMLLASTPSLAKDTGVRIWTPTEVPDVPERLDGDGYADVRPILVKVKVAVSLPYYNYRAWKLSRALGHRYLGFVKMYRGPRYPL